MVHGAVPDDELDGDLAPERRDPLPTKVGTDVEMEAVRAKEECAGRKECAAAAVGVGRRVGDAGPGSGGLPVEREADAFGGGTSRGIEDVGREGGGHG